MLGDPASVTLVPPDGQKAGILTKCAAAFEGCLTACLVSLSATTTVSHVSVSVCVGCVFRVRSACDPARSTTRVFSTTDRLAAGHFPAFLVSRPLAPWLIGVVLRPPSLHVYVLYCQHPTRSCDPLHRPLNKWHSFGGCDFPHVCTCLPGFSGAVPRVTSPVPISRAFCLGRD